MYKVQKEGVVIVTVSICTLIVLALFTKYWVLGFDEAYFFNFNGFSVNCEYTSPGCYLRDDGSFKEYIFGFSLYFKTALILILPITAYGMLRAFGVIGRLFKFEEKLFKFISEDK